jgi:hypothetical protein
MKKMIKFVAITAVPLALVLGCTQVSAASNMTVSGIAPISALSASAYSDVAPEAQILNYSLNGINFTCTSYSSGRTFGGAIGPHSYWHGPIDSNCLISAPNGITAGDSFVGVGSYEPVFHDGYRRWNVDNQVIGEKYSGLIAVSAP